MTHSKEAIENWRELQETLKRIQQLSRLVIFQTLPNPTRRKRLSKNVLGLLSAIRVMSAPLCCSRRCAVGAPCAHVASGRGFNLHSFAPHGRISLSARLRAPLRTPGTDALASKWNAPASQSFVIQRFRCDAVRINFNVSSGNRKPSACSSNAASVNRSR